MSAAPGVPLAKAGHSTPGCPVPALSLPSRDLGVSQKSGSSITTLPDSSRLDYSGPVTYPDFKRALDDVAPLMKRPATLGRALQQLQEADKLHCHLVGSSSAQALYKMASCLALAAAAELQRQPQETHWYDVSPGLPPMDTGKTGKSLAEARADLAMVFLERAVEAGYPITAKLQADPDLRALADLRPLLFASLGTRSQSKAYVQLVARQSPSTLRA